ncbi:MAG: rhodanese-like domain-containing protein [bacterium]|nr:rhodanese-like domain-containing protein [bacterium]
MKKIRSFITLTAIISAGLSAGISAAESVRISKIPDELITRNLQKHDSSLAISVEAVRYKIKRKQPFTMVDVRRKQAFERLHIPGSISIPLYAVKTKTYLKPVPVVLVSEGFHYAEILDECRLLAKRGFKVFILDGGLPAWKRKGGQLTGDLFVLDEMKAVSPRAFFRAKDNENTEVVDISSTRSAASSKLFPYARHIPIFNGPDGSLAELRRLNKKNRPFQTIVILNETGEQCEKAENMMNRKGIESFYLRGGVVGYKKYLNDLLLSWKTRDSRMKTVGNCKLCWEKVEEKTNRRNN